MINKKNRMTANDKRNKGTAFMKVQTFLKTSYDRELWESRLSFFYLTHLVPMHSITTS